MEEGMNQETGVTVTIPDKEARNWAMFCHLSALSGFFIPFGNVLGPLIVWVIKKDSSPFIDDQGKESLNFQLTVTIAVFVCFLLMLVLIGVVLVAVVGIYALVMTVIASINANDGVTYRYPYTFRFFR